MVIVEKALLYNECIHIFIQHHRRIISISLKIFENLIAVVSAAQNNHLEDKGK